MRVTLARMTATCCLISPLALGAHIVLADPSPAAKNLSPEMVQRVSPAFASYTQDKLLSEVWSRPGLTQRDRSLITVATLIAKNQTIEMPYHFNRALDNGIKPAELAEIIAHLAFYAGWANANQAVVFADETFDKRGVTADQVNAPGPTLPVDAASDEARRKAVESQVGAVSEGLAHYTNELLFNDLWRRPGLSARDRSLVTVSALIANGQVAQLPFHLNRAMDNGVTKAQVSEILTHLAFYAGWPNVFSAVPVVKDVLDKRAG